MLILINASIPLFFSAITMRMVLVTLAVVMATLPPVYTRYWGPRPLTDTANEAAITKMPEDYRRVVSTAERILVAIAYDVAIARRPTRRRPPYVGMTRERRNGRPFYRIRAAIPGPLPVFPRWQTKAPAAPSTVVIPPWHLRIHRFG